jgi:glycosyltransferase involved in cell wall biosynthesis
VQASALTLAFDLLRFGSTVDVVGLFPSLETDSVGGVQASGREAWSAIVTQVGNQRAKPVCYEHGTSRLKAVVRALRTGKRPAVVLVWHIHLLKLLPFLAHSDARVILFLHGIEAWLEQDGVTCYLLKKVDMFLSNSEHTWARFVECNPAFGGMQHRTVHLGAGSGLTMASPSPSSSPAVLMIGRLDKGEAYKGHGQMIEAWPRVLERTPDARLWIAGGGDLRRRLEALARDHALNGSVRFFGQVSELEKEQLIGQSRCLALPSRGEGFGLVYLEAMRMGRPCLVSDADAGREVVNPPEAGLAVDPDDPQQVADAVQRMITPGSEWDDWSRRARARYEARFTAEHFRQRLVNALFDS